MDLVELTPERQAFVRALRQALSGMSRADLLAASEVLLGCLANATHTRDLSSLQRWLLTSE